MFNGPLDAIITLSEDPKAYILPEVGKVIAGSKGERRVFFFWLLAECGLRAGEHAGLKLTDIDGDKLTVNQAVWNDDEQTPKMDNSTRTIALSPQLVTLVWEQIARQRAKGQEFIFSASTGSPVDMNVFRKRKLRKDWSSLGIQQERGKAFHASATSTQTLWTSWVFP